MEQVSGLGKNTFSFVQKQCINIYLLELESLNGAVVAAITSIKGGLRGVFFWTIVALYRFNNPLPPLLRGN